MYIANFTEYYDNNFFSICTENEYNIDMIISKLISTIPCGLHFYVL